MKFLGNIIYFSEQYLQKKDPQKYNGKDELVKKYFQNMDEIEKQFEIFVAKLGGWEETKFLLKKAVNSASVKGAVEQQLSRNDQNPGDIVNKMITIKTKEIIKNKEALGKVCLDDNYKNFSKVLSENVSAILKYAKENIISKNPSDLR